MMLNRAMEQAAAMAERPKRVTDPLHRIPFTCANTRPAPPPRRASFRDTRCEHKRTAGFGVRTLTLFIHAM